MVKLTRSFSFFLVLVLAACGGESGKVKYDIKIPVNDPAKLSANVRTIYDSLEAGKEISFDEITNALAKSHASFYTNGSAKVGEMLSLVDEAKRTAPDADPHKRKVQYEAWLAKKKGSTTVYNSEANTLFHFLLENKMQCYSGTVLNQLVNRKATAAKNFRNENWVAIFESGHILTGYLKQVSGKWNLFGVETTADGLAQVEYGPVDAISSEVRIVDAEYWALTELFKFELKDALTTGNAILEYTSNRYGLGNKYMRIEGTQAAITKINASPFSFGTADTTPGNRARGKFDKRSRGSILGGNPNPLIASYPDVPGEKEAIIAEINSLISVKGALPLSLPPAGTFCSEYMRYAYNGGASVCSAEGAPIDSLSGHAAFYLPYVSAEGLGELLNALTNAH